MLHELHADLVRALSLDTSPGFPAPPDDEAGAEAALRKLAAAATRHDRQVPVFFLDHIDEITRPHRGDIRTLDRLTRLLYRLSMHEDGQGRAVVIVAGQDDHLLALPNFTMDGKQIINPLWNRLKAHYVPFFTKDELGDFFARLGGMIGMSLSVEAVNEAYRLTGGHKYLARRLGSMLFDRMAKLHKVVAIEIDAAGIRAAAEELLVKDGEYLRAVFGHVPVFGRALLTKLARGSVHQDDLPRDWRSAPVHGSSTALSFVLKYSLVFRDGLTYRLMIGLLSEWLIHHYAPNVAHVEGEGIKGGRPTGPSGTVIVTRKPNDKLVIELRCIMRECFDNSELERLLHEGIGVRARDVVVPTLAIPDQVERILMWAIDGDRFDDLYAAVRNVRPQRFSVPAEKIG